MAKLKRIVCIVQARMGSTRLPGKVMLSIGKTTVINAILLRLTQSKFLNETIVATSLKKDNDYLEKYFIDL